jgi:hypothetical protein
MAMEDITVEFVIDVIDKELWKDLPFERRHCCWIRIDGEGSYYLGSIKIDYRRKIKGGWEVDATCVMLFQTPRDGLSHRPGEMLGRVEIVVDDRLRVQNFSYKSMPEALGTRHSSSLDGLCENRDLVMLDLRDLGLRELPEDVWKLRELRYLLLRDNMLTELPEDIGKLKSLEYLDLSSNRLGRLPPQIGELKNLWTLDLRCNRLRSLPDEISNLQNLECLYLEDIWCPDLEHNRFSEEEKSRIKKLLPECLVSYPMSLQDQLEGMSLSIGGSPVPQDKKRL